MFLIKIEYSNNKVKKIFEDYRLLTKCAGLTLARTIKLRLDQIRASVSFNSFLISNLGKPHRLGDSRNYGIHISANYRLIIEPDSKSLSPEELSRCYAITVKGVVDYHGAKESWLIS